MPVPSACAPDLAWRAAVQHPFLDAVRDGTLPATAFAGWLTQDALFVRDLLGFQARLLARAPRGAERVLAGGLVSLVDELDWFDEQARAGGLDLAVAPLPVTTAYADLLGRLDAARYPVAITALWALERVYLLGWQHAAPGAPAFRDCVQHWTDPGFAAYVTALGDLADAAGAPPDAVAEVLALEAAFWGAAVDGGATG